MNPPLKWPGGKAKLIETLRRRVPGDRQRLIAPCIGGGAFEFNSGYQELVIGDINPDLVNFYRQLKRSDRFIDYCAEWFGVFNSEADYEALRGMFNSVSVQAKLKGALFLFLNRHGYNGLCRYSANGFNVPYGHHKKAPSFPRDSMEWLHQRLQTVEIVCSDFEALIDMAGSGDAVYIDPPYLPLNDESFTDYTAIPFTTDDHRRLAETASRAKRRGAVVVVSNHNTWLAREIYREGKQYKVKVQRSIGASADSRGKVDELIVVYAK